MLKRIILPMLITVSLLYGGMVAAASLSAGELSYGVKGSQYAAEDQKPGNSPDSANEAAKNSRKHSCCGVKED